MGTAPRNPIHEIRTLGRKPIFAKARLINTPNGRATTTKNNANSTEIPITGSKRDG